MSKPETSQLFQNKAVYSHEAVTFTVKDLGGCLTAPFLYLFLALANKLPLQKINELYRSICSIIWLVQLWNRNVKIGVKADQYHQKHTD